MAGSFFDPDHLTVSALGTLFFGGHDGAGEANLWVPDGTDAGTQELTGPGTPSLRLLPHSVVPFGGGVAFATSDVSRPGPWFSDGTAAGTTHLTVPSMGGNSSYASNLAPFAGKLCFPGSNGLPGSDLWVTDGTVAGTQELQVAGASASFSLSPSALVSIGTKLVPTGLDAANNWGLWVSDGTAAGTVELHVAGLNTADGLHGQPSGLLAFGTKAAFAAANTFGQEGVWVTDGTAAGTQELPAAYVSSWGAPMAALSGNRLAFVASDGSGVREIWITDGAAAGSQELHPTAAATDLNPNGLIALEGRALFDGLDASGVRDLWTSDGTSAGTSVLLSGPITLQDGETSISAETSGSTPIPSPTPTLTLQQAFVTLLYEGLLGRTPGQSEVQGWTNLIDAYTSETTIAQGFLSSAEYQSVSDGQFVEGLYRSMLGRTAGTTEVQGWITALASEASRAQVATGFALNPEAQQRWVSVIASASS